MASRATAPLKLLAFDTSTDRLSVAAQNGTRVVEHSGPGGAQASAQLIPRIQAVLAEAGLALNTLNALVLGRGPGSFTGVRTACSVAQGLAFAAQVPTLPLDTLLAIAEDARHQHGCTQVVAVLDARMDEVYACAYQFDGQRWSALDECVVCAPEDLDVPAGFTVAGHAQAVYGERLAPHAPHVPARPEAQALLRLAPDALARAADASPGAAQPLYVRNKVAYTTEERAQRAAAKDAAAASAARTEGGA